MQLGLPHFNHIVVCMNIVDGYVLLGLKNNIRGIMRTTLLIILAFIPVSVCVVLYRFYKTRKKYGKIARIFEVLYVIFHLTVSGIIVFSIHRYYSGILFP